MRARAYCAGVRAVCRSERVYEPACARWTAHCQSSWTHLTTIWRLVPTRSESSRSPAFLRKVSKDDTTAPPMQTEEEITDTNSNVDTFDVSPERREKQ